MNVRTETIGQTTLVIPEGRVDFGTAAAFEKHLERALAGTAGPPKALIVDCTGLEYVSSAGLRAFLVTARGSQRAGIQFALCALKPAVREVFDLSGFSRIIAVHADRATALAHAQPGKA
jgi:anti-sigma B factor antagonist